MKIGLLRLVVLAGRVVLVLFVSLTRRHRYRVRLPRALGVAVLLVRMAALCLWAGSGWSRVLISYPGKHRHFAVLISYLGTSFVSALSRCQGTCYF